jgi:uncharacterized protein (TIRG00374 family)
VNRGVKLAIALVIGLVLLAISLWGIDFGEMRGHMARARPIWIVFAGALYLLAYVVRSLRWRLILSPVEKITVGESFSMMMAGYFLNYVIPIRAGEVAKSFFLKRLRGVPIATSLPTVFVDKLLELMSIMVVLLLVPILWSSPCSACSSWPSPFSFSPSGTRRRRPRSCAGSSRGCRDGPTSASPSGWGSSSAA